MTTYSVRLRLELHREGLRELVRQIRQELAASYQPVDVGGSYADGTFTIWIVLTAKDEQQAVDYALRALSFGAARAAGGETAISGASLAELVTGTEAPPDLEWLHVLETSAERVVLVSGDVNLLSV